jgi:site-specific DNA-methyltransferase (adenine-specific)
MDNTRNCPLSTRLLTQRRAGCQFSIVYFMQNNLLVARNTLKALPSIESESIDMVYMDPPFFTQRKHQLKNRSNESFSFKDTWKDISDYTNFIKKVLVECQRVLKPSGSIFLHCDKTASHHLRLLLDEIFGAVNFQSEIIWTYRRWSNAKKGLLNSHQNIFFYSKSSDFKFYPIYTDYSPSTNLDQILQDRIRNSEGKSIYKRDEQQETVLTKEKKGVPLSDVWDIPFLNPKARERVGYPTQKPVFLLQRMIELTTQAGDVILDPMCGSGTTCVAAKSLDREYIGIDQSKDAIKIAKKRLEEMIISYSTINKNGVNALFSKTRIEAAILHSIKAFPVQRNGGIDGFLKAFMDEKPVPIKIQSAKESLESAHSKLIKATSLTKFHWKILIQTKATDEVLEKGENVILLQSLDLQLEMNVKR